ncbi:MAG: phosphotransferase, partial [Actinomycetia bacterium]|nr:phosphotransferase [Actinomycetes bacterium]
MKLTDGRLVDDGFHRRLEVLASLAQVDESVVGPLEFGSRLVAQLDEWLGVVYPFVAGRVPDLTDESDVRRMAATLSKFHTSLDRLGPVDLPSVAALRETDWVSGAEGFGRAQLLHGDFSATNTLLVGGRVRVIDFDDCGYGPVEFDVGNTLYMVLFDASMSSRMRPYERFRSWFVDEYRSESGRSVTDA